MAAANSVSARVEHARHELSAHDVAIGLALIAGLGFALLVVQDPMVHDSLHNFRHSAGITCH
jgi:cobalt transporter subunit CbtB